MCGIAGELRRGGVSAAWLDAATDCLAHRGPDDHGVWTSDDNSVGFGHRRLAVLDLSASARQPMKTRDGRITLAFNGEIYNYKDVRSELRSVGYQFASTGDTEVVLHALAEWGEGALAKLDGMFAIAAYDAQSRRLLLARDRVGEKPLFVWPRPDGVAFASELKALTLHPRFSKKIEPLAMEWYLAYGYVPRAHCIFAGVSKILPGHFAWCGTDGELVQRPYWQLPDAEIGKTDKHALVDRLDSLLESAVGRQLVADVPVGILLSGGLDSSLITAYASAIATETVRTFTVVFPGHSKLDESAHASRVASYFGTIHTELPADEVEAPLLAKLARQYDEPLGDSSAIPTYLVSRLIRPHATVALGGDGGDELFGGYPHYSWLRQQQLARSVVPRPVRLALSRIAASRPVGTRGRNQAMGFAETMPGSIAQANLMFPASTRSLLAGHWIDVATRIPELEKASLARAHGGHAAAASSVVDFLTYLPDDLLVKVDRASMLASLEVRAPFLDRRIVEFAFREVRPELRATARNRKVLLRDLAVRRLPTDFDRTRKQGFSIPMGSWLSGPLQPLVKDILLSEGEKAFDRREVARLLERPDVATRNAQRVYSLLMFELWRREYSVSLNAP